MFLEKCPSQKFLTFGAAPGLGPYHTENRVEREREETRGRQISRTDLREREARTESSTETTDDANEALQRQSRSVIDTHRETETSADSGRRQGDTPTGPTSIRARRDADERHWWKLPSVS
ncbi:hypothetical protein U1Q18_028908 [Sarracenia purpurea var. burkii]